MCKPKDICMMAKEQDLVNAPFGLHLSIKPMMFKPIKPIKHVHFFIC